jgi:hypothetical protein
MLKSNLVTCFRVANIYLTGWSKWLVLLILSLVCQPYQVVSSTVWLKVGFALER